MVLWWGIATAIFILLIVICVCDIKQRIVPNVAVIILFAFAVTIVMLEYVYQDKFAFPTQNISLFERLLGAFIAFTPLALVAFTTHSIGFGDVKLISVLGLILGLKGTFIMLCATAVLGAIGALVCVIVNRIKDGNIKTTLCYAPYICAGACIACAIVIT